MRLIRRYEYGFSSLLVSFAKRSRGACTGYASRRAADRLVKAARLAAVGRLIIRLKMNLPRDVIQVGLGGRT